MLKKDAITSEWTTYGDDGISALMLSGRTSLALLLSSALTTEITLSHDGTQLFWYIAFKLEDEVSGSIDERGQAILFRSEQSQGSPMEWKQQGDKATLGTSPGSDDSRRFGPVVAFARTSVDTFVTGTTTVVGEITSIFDIHLGTPKVHRLQNGVWSSEVKDSLIHYSVADIEDVVFDPLVGVSVAISGDGTSIAVASPDSGQLLLLGDKKDTGKVQVFEPAPPRHTLLTNWKHKGVAMRGTGENHKFGIVSMSNDGRTMAVGTPNRERQRAGQVQVFRYNQEEDEWKPFFQDSKPSNTINNIDGKYGQVVCLSPNGRVLAVAHPLLGEVCVFDVEENKQIGECFQENIPERNEDMLNFKLALSHDGSRLVIGVPPTRTEIGQMRVYQLLE